MKLLHFFITKEEYNPIILQGAKNEIWLENLQKPYKIIRISSNYIHNNEQLEYDNFKATKISEQIKNKTLSLSLNILNIYTNLSDNVDLETNYNVMNIYAKNEKDLKRYDFLNDIFPNILAKIKFKEKGEELFVKIAGDLNEKNNIVNQKADEVFKAKPIIITYIIMAICILIYLLGGLFGDNRIIAYFGNIPLAVKSGEFYRLITSGFIHADVLHLGFNMYALYIIGPQIENFYGKFKFSIIYLVSLILGSLLSAVLANPLSVSVGASGAIFGLLGSILYFGYYYRVYLGTVIKSQIIPIIVINLLIGFMANGIDNAAHIGGLIGGVLGSMIVGVKYKSDKSSQINGVIITTILTSFLIYLLFSR